MWGLSAQVLQAVSSWSLTVAGVAGAVAVAACLLSAVASAKLAEQVRARADREVAEAQQHAARTAGQADETRIRDQILARAEGELQSQAHDAPAGRAGDPEAFARRAHAFAALIRSRTPELALIVGHGPGAHADGQVLRQALKAAGVTVRWCRLKPAAAADRTGPDDGLTVYADPTGPEAAVLVQALTTVGFKTELAAADHADPGLPRPAIYLAPGGAPSASGLATCNPVIGGR